MHPELEIVVRIHPEWDGWRSAEVRLADLENIHWLQPAGAPRALLHGFVRCTDIVTGGIPHDCEPGSRPHRLLVCVLKRHAIPTTYEWLVRCANEVRAAV